MASVCLIVCFFLAPMDEYAWFCSQKNHIRLQKRFDCSSFFHFMPLSPRMMREWWTPFTALRTGNNNNTILSLQQNCVRFVSLRVVKKPRMDASWGGGTLLLGRSWAASSEARGSRLPDALPDNTMNEGVLVNAGCFGLRGGNRLLSQCCQIRNVKFYYDGWFESLGILEAIRGKREKGFCRCVLFCFLLLFFFFF